MTHFLLKNKKWMILLFLSATTLLAFWQVVHCDFINYDDPDYVSENIHLRNGISIEGMRWAFTTTHAANWHPLTWISHMLDVQLFGLNPRGHHLMNLFFHIVNTLLLFLVLNRMTKALWQSAFVAALFALHPLHVESVAWVSERKDVLSTLFWLLTMGAYLYYVEQLGLKRYLAVIVFFSLGLMAKPMLVTLPFVLLLLDFWPLNRFENRAAATGRPAGLQHHWALMCPLIWEKVPLLVLSALFSIITYLVQKQAGAVVPIEGIPLSGRVSNAFVSYIFYIDKMIWPADLALLYPHPVSWPLWLVAGAALPIIAATTMAILKAQRFPWLAVGWLWYVGTLVPVIGLVQVGIQTRADRYSYIPLIGLFIIAAWGVPELVKGCRYRKEALAVSSAFILLCLFTITWTQAGYWQNNITLYDHTLSVTENNYMVFNNRGNTYLRLGNYSLAIQDYDRAIEIYHNFSMAYNNRGLAYGNLGKYTRAIEDFDRAVEIDPTYPMAYYNRGNAYLELGNFNRAIENYDKAIAINSQIPLVYYIRGKAYGRSGNDARAIMDFDRAVELDPGYALAFYNRGMAYGKLGRYDHVSEDLITAARLGSEDAMKFLTNHGVNWQ
jgi:protein O-mannosyl-transferase